MSACASNTSLKVIGILLAVALFSNSVFCETGLQVQIVNQDVNIYRDVNQSLFLNCSVANDNGGPIKSISWKINGRSKKATFLSESWSILEIGKLSQSNAGYYKCVAEGNKSEQTAEVFVNIKGKPKIFKSGESKLFTSSPQWPHGGSLTLQCYATGSKVIKFRWLMNGKELGPGDPKYYFIGNQNHYTLNFRIVYFKEAKLTCEARNEYGMDNYSIGVSVKNRAGPVETRAERSVISSNVGQASELVCNGKNVRKVDADTIWFFKGKELTEEFIANSSRLHAKAVYGPSREMTVRMTLTINQTSMVDAGNYTCTVTINQDMYNETIVLVVKGKEPSGGKEKKGLATPDLIGLIIGVILIIIVLVLLMLYYIKRSKKTNYPKIPEGPFKYGAFITYNSQDFHWVEANLLPLLENNDIKFCIHYRNFEPGVAIQENMVNSVYMSRVVIVVMSNNYMKSKYCKAELDYAVHRALEEHGTNPLVILQIDPAIHKNKLPKEIKNKTFLDFTSNVEKATWEKRLLKYVKWNGNDENENEGGKEEGKEEGEHATLIKQRDEEKKNCLV